MPTLTKSLEKRIQELRSSIDAQKAELAAYERVWEVERAKGNRSPVAQTPDDEPELEKPVRESVTLADPEFTGNKTEFITSILRARGTSGATPKEIDDVFSAHAIARSKNLIYNALSFLLKRKRLIRRAGRYFPLSAGSAAKKSAPSTKRRISAEGLKRISEANKKRWAALRAAKGRKKAAR